MIRDLDAEFFHWCGFISFKNAFCFFGQLIILKSGKYDFLVLTRQSLTTGSRKFSLKVFGYSVPLPNIYQQYWKLLLKYLLFQLYSMHLFCSMAASSGQPYNQIAILEASRSNKLSTVYFYMRAISLRFVALNSVSFGSSAILEAATSFPPSTSTCAPSLSGLLHLFLQVLDSSAILEAEISFLPSTSTCAPSLSGLLH